MSKEKNIIEVEKQAEQIISLPIEEESKVEAEASAEEKKSDNNFCPEESYLMLSNSFHSFAKEFIKIATKGEVTIEDDEMQSLNESGAALLKKYDKSGNMGEYGPEMIYLMTGLSIGSRALVEKALNKPDKKSKDQEQAEKFIEPINEKKKDNFEGLIANV
ncbi:MAG: hypothetical protein KC589_08865 [Nanoarchaeota archaeon]|nr:hypothetical protein [Nanoarchaeota archaeon]MCA9497031.1 hypothetical protein [Nanoarchaeota archaeon]